MAVILTDVSINCLFLVAVLLPVPNQLELKGWITLIPDISLLNKKLILVGYLLYFFDVAR